MSLGAALFVVSQRDDRKVIFDCCDQAGFQPIYTARDFTQALGMIEQDPGIALVIVEFGTRLSAAEAFCERVVDYRKELRIVGVLATADQSYQPFALDGVHAWVRSPVDRREFKHRLLEAVRSNADSAALGLDADSCVDPVLITEAGRVVASNAAFDHLLGTSPKQLCDQDLSAVLELQPGDTSVWLKSRIGPPLRMHAHLFKQRARTFWIFVNPSPGEQAQGWLVSCRDSLSADTQSGALESWADQLCARHRLQIFAVVVERKGSDQEPTLLVGSQAAQLPPGSDMLWEQPVYREVLAGQRVMMLEGAQRTRTDAIVRKLKMDWLCAIPLRDDHARPLGMLLTGGQGAPVELAVLEQGLHILAGRFALEWISHQHWLESRYQGLHDHLTKLPNRLLFNDRLGSAIVEAQRSGEQFSLLLLDLDRFKNINDNLGFSAGDQVLLGVSKRIKASLRGSDTVARYATDEFTLILRHVIQRDDVLRTADKLIRVLASPLVLPDGNEVQLTCSIGVCFYPTDGSNADDLLKHADVAMQTAKSMGRNNAQVYVAVKEDSRQQRLALESSLRHAERNRELRAFYQPKIDTTSEDIIGMESLIRWEHPELGLISPGFFIPLAEDTGLIVPIGEWILRASCADAKRWNDKFGLDLKVSVNLSALQLKQPNLVAVVKEALKETGLPAHLLDLEVTESLNLKEIPGLIDLLTQIRQLGCSISIDDFGTGQASLEYLKRFPCDAIKIDQTFVRNIGVDPDDEAIVRATIAMAHNMGLLVVAEGVETEDHLRFLREQQCEHLQGFLFCRPLPPLSFESMLAEREKMLKSG